MAGVALAPVRVRLALCTLALLTAFNKAAAQPAPAPEPAPAGEPAAEPPPPPPPAAASPSTPAAQTTHDAWSGAYPNPPPEGPPPGPPPRLEGAEYGRRPVELIPALLLLSPQCSSGDRSGDRCEGVGGGLGLEFSALWRMSPWFAWGGALGLAGFGYEPPSRLGLREASAGGAFLSLLARVYFLDEGSFDPYLELGVGGGFMATAAREADGVRYENTGAGSAVRAGAGIDFYLGRSLRLGPSFAWTHLFVDKIRRCEAGGGDCVDRAKDDDGHLSGHWAIGAKLTILIGDEM